MVRLMLLALSLDFNHPFIPRSPLNWFPACFLIQTYAVHAFTNHLTCLPSTPVSAFPSIVPTPVLACFFLPHDLTSAQSPNIHSESHSLIQLKESYRSVLGDPFGIDLHQRLSMFTASYARAGT
ncbi:hypothetical protein B0H13DRAFT_2282423 [Mycena leptocephala]|nr:hypothetical protein B0H13DRAFT_2282423 [Mycena leptocephala]